MAIEKRCCNVGVFFYDTAKHHVLCDYCPAILEVVGYIYLVLTRLDAHVYHGCPYWPRSPRI